MAGGAERYSLCATTWRDAYGQNNLRCAPGDAATVAYRQRWRTPTPRLVASGYLTRLATSSYLLRCGTRSATRISAGVSPRIAFPWRDLTVTRCRAAYSSRSSGCFSRTCGRSNYRWPEGVAGGAATTYAVQHLAAWQPHVPLMRWAGSCL